jgi:integrase
MPEIHRISDGNVSVFLRQHKDGNCYYARFKIANKKVSDGKRYITETLKTKSLELALDKARHRFAEISLFERQGKTIRSGTVADEIDAFMSEYVNGVKQGLSGYSTAMLRGFRKTIVRYFKEYLGKKSLQDVSIEDLQGYEEWRQNYWKKHKEILKKEHGNFKLRASKRTLEWEITSFKRLLRWSQLRGRYFGNALDFTFSVGEKTTRSAFTTSQWSKITGYMRRKKWLTVGKHGNDARLQRYRKMLRAYILFMANTGLRVGEARNLKWDNLTFVKGNTAEGNKLLISIAASQSKVKKGREAVGTEGAYRVMQEYLKLRKSENDFAKPNDLIWCDVNGKVIGHFREGFNNLLNEVEVKLDSDGNSLTVYSLRHSYITWRLKAGVNVYQLATNCGTSVAMIETYYAHARSHEFAEELTKGYRRKS